MSKDLPEHIIQEQSRLFYEELLEALVRQVDAELLEAVVLQALEAVDVQGSNASRFTL